MQNLKIIYDALGTQLEVIADDVKSAGTHNITWNAKNYASGIYFYKLEADNFVQVRKMILMKQYIHVQLVSSQLDLKGLRKLSPCLF